MRTYLDSGVLFWAWRGQEEEHRKAMEIINDPDREFVSGVFLKLETLPKATYFQIEEERSLYQGFFNLCVELVDGSTALCRRALSEAERKGLGAIDTLHIESALEAGAEEIVTTEKPEKAIHRTDRIRIRSIA